MELIRNAPHFDPKWYLDTYPDVAAAGLDPATHFLIYGGRERRDPGPRFNTSGYLARHPEVDGNSVNPLLHFLQNQAFDLIGLKERFDRECMAKLQSFLASDTLLELPPHAPPQVSIIVVVHNRAELTLECLRALANALSVPAEIIIVDNASSDTTAALLARLSGPRIVRNEENLHFLNAVNRAASQARGDAILLLNNDAFVRPGAIAAACARLHEEANVGAVGGKLVLLDGTLQEAGSIIWRDGTCAGYGRGLSPADTEFQFRRDVDYCSGAFLLVRRPVFERLTGFDDRYSPAYYEETDLCMRMREIGFRVVYEPRAEVLHFEFGTANSTALALQARHRAIFVERHRDALQRAHCDPSVPMLAARMRATHAGRILIIDDDFPDGTQGSGLPRANALLRAILDAGWFVTLFPTNSRDSWQDAYRVVPADVELVAGASQPPLNRFLKERAGYYDAILVSRPHNMAQFNQATAGARMSAAVIYDAEAIFAKREALRDEVMKQPWPDAERGRRIAAEIGLAESADVVLTVNAEEAAAFREIVPHDIRVLGHSVACDPTPTPFDDRSGIFFVGPLLEDDTPNVDSILWFTQQVMPILDRRLGTGYDLTVIGKVTSRRAMEIASPRVKLLGRIEDIRPYSAKCKVFIAPTRFASGIPMKVHSAAAAGLPVITTPLLAGQLGWRHGIELLAADDPEGFAAETQRAYTDRALWTTLRQNALERMKRDCDPAQFSIKVRAVLDAVKAPSRRTP